MSSRRTLKLLAFGLLVAAVTCASSDTLTISSIQIRHYLNETGTLSAPIPEGKVLEDVPTRDRSGPDGGQSTETMVDVIVSGPPKSYFQGRRIELEVTDQKGATITRMKAQVGALNETGTYYASFLLPDTGCEPLVISAKLNVPNIKLTRRVEFKCSP